MDEDEGIFIMRRKSSQFPVLRKCRGVSLGTGNFLPRLRRQRAISFRTPVAIKLPHPSYFLDHIEIEIGHQHLIFVAASLSENLAARIAEITLAVKFTDIPWLFPANTVDRTDEVSVRRGMRGLLQFPQIFR